MTPRGSEAGFSLVESLVALAVIASMASLLFEAVSINARAAQHVAQKRAAIMLARSLLAQAVLPSGPDQLEETGQSNDMSWRLSRRSIDRGARNEDVPLEEVRIDINERATGRSLTTIRTLRLTR